MHVSKLFFGAGIVVLFFSCSPGRSVNKSSKPFPNRYSLDRLPENWKKPATLKAIDDILPAAITQLKNSRSCMNCNAAYSITIHLDSLFILNETVVSEVISDKVPDRIVKPDVILPTITEMTCKFKFKSHLAVEDSAGKEIVHLVIVDGVEDTYTINGDPYSTARANAKSSPIYFAKDYPGVIRGRPVLVPSEDELLEFTKQKLKVIQKRIHDLQNSANSK